MATIHEVLAEIQDLTNQNLKILEALNDSFYTSREHVSVEINNNTYTLPSFLALENKVNTLSDNFYNLVNAPKTGEAAFVFDGATQRIQMKGFSNTPLPLNVSAEDGKFYVEKNDVLKDFLTPLPYIKWNITELPIDIKHVNVRKVIPKNSGLRNLISNLVDPTYGNVYKTLVNYVEDEDYVMYDTVMDVPIIDGIADGTYTIAEVSDKIIDQNLEEYYTIRFNEDLTYKIKNGTIQKDFKLGDVLVTYDDKSSFEIIGLSKERRTVEVKVKGGAYYDLTVWDVADLDSSKMRILQQQEEVTDHYLKVPLEEDDYVCIFLAPINELNIQAPWSKALRVDTSNLVGEFNDNNYKYQDFYKLFVNNIGDTLLEVSSMMSNYINNYTNAEYTSLVNMTPALDPNCFKIIEINTHIANSEPVAKIRKLYQQISDTKQKVSAQVAKISSLNEQMASTTYATNSAVSNMINNNLAAANRELTNLRNTECALQLELSSTANSSDTPIQNAKYHIRGYYDYESFQDSNNTPEIVKIEVQYRYRSSGQYTDRSLILNDGKFIYSEWKSMESPYRKKIGYHDGVMMRYEWSPNNDMNDEPSFNQIDIPIKQGEYVEMKIRVLYDLGRPFVEVWSNWSDVLDYTFPADFVFQKDVATIIQENMQENFKNQITNTLDSNGITRHVSNQVPSDGSGITYFHQPDNIASGFRTESDNKIISLRDKLFEMTNKIAELDALVNGIESPLTVTIQNGQSEIEVFSSSDNSIIVPSYNANENYLNDAGTSKYRLAQFIIKIANTSKYPVRLYSLFRGPAATDLLPTTRGLGEVSDYLSVDSNNTAITPFIWVNSGGSSSTSGEPSIQKMNQIVYFRILDAYDGITTFYSADAPQATTIRGNKIYNYNTFINGTYTIGANGSMKYMKYDDNDPVDDIGAFCYPIVNTINDISIPVTDSHVNFFRLDIGESIMIPINFEYYLKSTDGSNSIQKTISFDIKHSLYQPAENYKVTFKANYGLVAREILQNAITENTLAASAEYHSVTR